MELHKSFHLGDEKHQMLNLNRRLETYLSRVKLLEQENALLEKEIEAMRCSNRGASSRRKGLEEEMLQVRLEVESAWRERVFAEMEVCKVAEELQNLDFQRQREAEEDVGHMEAEISRSRATMTPMMAQRGNQTLDLLQRATRAWQVEAEVHQTQLDQLEDTLNQSRSRLSEVNKEKKESEMKLRALEKEMDSARDVRKHLERNAQQQGDGFKEEIQTLQEHWESLEAEKEELSDHIDHLLLENRGLQQQKVALGLEVATYRALLDSESLRGDISLSNQPRNIPDAGFSPRGVTKNYQSQMSTRHKTTSLSSVRGITGKRPTAINSTPTWSRKPVTVTETPKKSSKSAYEDTTKSTWVPPYPKILQDGAVENFRPQEVQEKVTYAEPLSPPNEQEAETTPVDKEGEEDWNNVGVKPPEEGSVIEPVVSYQVESVLSKEPAFNEDVSQNQFTTPNLTPYHVKMSEEHGGFSDDSERDVTSEIPQNQHAPIEAWVEKERKGKEEEHVREERSDSEAEAVIEPNYDSRTGSPMSECEPQENLFNSREENIRKEDAVEMRQEIGGSLERTNEMEDRLYPDGEEMDTWDSVIERKVDVKTEDGVKKDEEKQKHAEPEEDISARDHEKREMRQGFATDVQQDNNVSSAMMDTQVDDEGKHAVLDQDNEEEDEEEDSQNVSVSWRTEVESDSYAQENTLADTRPLIRYKSDECDANTHASHLEESESSEGEQEKKIGELGSWSEGKSKRFGTMEDLCEEVEGEALDEDYNLEYSHIGDRDVEQASLVNEEEMIGKVSEGHSEEEPEELTKPTAPTYVDYDEELETDRLVEQELENLATDSYSAHFAQQQVSENERCTIWKCRKKKMLESLFVQRLK
ncbi:Nestin [Dissostichus eleginoides]|uniref:Nestin n=1 Tax=Dissostichus eleginoides TaxID=100907 RepID=A0AAD9FE62_DISEL|nr:Nestin [Dissostichus eleginoides]